MVVSQPTDGSGSERSAWVPARTRWDFLHIFGSGNEQGSVVLIKCRGNYRSPPELPYLL